MQKPKWHRHVFYLTNHQHETINTLRKKVPGSFAGTVRNLIDAGLIFKQVSPSHTLDAAAVADAEEQLLKVFESDDIPVAARLTILRVLAALFGL